MWSRLCTGCLPYLHTDTQTHTHTHAEDRLSAHHTPPAAWLLVQLPQMPPHRLPPKAVRRYPPRFPGFRNSLIHFLHGRICLLGWVGLLFPPSPFPVRQPAPLRKPLGDGKNPHLQGERALQSQRLGLNSLTGCVILGKLCNLFEPQSAHLLNGHKKGTCQLLLGFKLIHVKFLAPGRY